MDDSMDASELIEREYALFTQNRSFLSTLDSQAAEQERLHRHALEKARSEHAAVREAAERARERMEIEMLRVRKLTEEAERRRLIEEQGELRRLEELANSQLRQHLLEQGKLEEQRRRRAELERERQIVQAGIREREQKELAAKALLLKQEEAARIEAERQAVAESTTDAAQATESTRPPRRAENGIESTTSQPQARPPQIISITHDVTQTKVEANNATPAIHQPRELAHGQYLALHKRLKDMRNYIQGECNKVPQQKAQLSEWRRTIKVRVAQINKKDPSANKEARESIQQILSQASRIPVPSVDISQYIVNSAVSPSAAPVQGSGVLLFLLNQLAKAIIRQLVEEVAVDTEMADFIGILTTWLFSQPDFCLNGQSLMDIFWAKYHFVCPPLFGIYGSESSASGRSRLGWYKDSDEWIPEEQHYTRMAGFGAGFAAITLRDFSRSKNQNPAPNRMFWEALARIVNTPSQELQPTHFILVKNMIERHVGRIVSTFGHAGLVAVRNALLRFPDKGPRRKDGSVDPVTTALKTLALRLQKDLLCIL